VSMHIKKDRRTSRRARLSVALLASASMLLAACGEAGGADSGEASEGTVRMGALLPLTGAGAEIGQAWKRGIELAVDKVNSNGGIALPDGKKMIDLEITDDESTPAGAVRGLQQELASGHKLLLGPGLSVSFATAYQTLQGNQDHLLLTPSIAAEPFLNGDGRLFKTQSSQSAQAIAEFAKYLAGKHKPKRVAVLQTQDPTGDSIGAGMVRGFKESGVEVVYDSKVAVSTTDFVPFISAMDATRPDMVILPYLDKVGNAFLSQAVQVGFTEPVFATSAGSQATVAGHEKAVSTFVWQLTTRSVNNPDDPKMKEFRADYQKKYGEQPKPIDFYSLSFYDPVLMLAKAIETAGTDSDVKAIGAGLKKVDSWPSRVLESRFDEKGLVHYPGQVATLKSGSVTYEDFGSGS
jgi:branched-chain amino acid transport system substrate-binding protein